MTSNNRNKLDEYHLKILRELLTYPANKYCFDCHQRGPTYVNVTIGSFVCTTCSGMLRGLTPPHRVKSITMATFTPEEIEIMKSKGNQYCKNTWLRLYDSEIPTSDEQQIKDFMIAKYEKKRYYVDPSTTTHCAINFANGSRTPSSLSSASSSSHNSPPSQNLSDSSSKLHCSLRSNSLNTNSVTSSTSSRFIVTNFESSVSSINFFDLPGIDSSANSETSFANFDNNPAFNSNKISGTFANGIRKSFNNSGACSGFDLTWGVHGSSFHKPALKSLPLAFSKWSITTENTSNMGKSKSELKIPSEDKYAALKDLDCQMKSQMLEKQQEELKQKISSNTELDANLNGFNWNTLFTNSQISSEPPTPFNPFSDETCTWKSSANCSINPFGSNSNDFWNGAVNWPNLKNELQPTTSNGWNSELSPFNVS
ncbi:hypothetical protein PGB90_007640 [Kerria lacca]